MCYADLYAKVCGAAQQYKEAGMTAGQCVMVFVPVSIELYIVLLGAMHAGLQVMLIDPSAGATFLRHCCRRKYPDAFVGVPKAHLLRLSSASLAFVKHSFVVDGVIPFARELGIKEASADPFPCMADHPALITFTSGSTGFPKAAVRTHRFLLAQYVALHKALGLEQGQVDLVTLPVFALANLASGVTSVLADMNFASPADAQPDLIHRQCVKAGVTRCAASPAFFEALLQRQMPDFASIHTGGAPVFPDLVRRCSEAMPRCKIIPVYGSTEAEPIAEWIDFSLTEAELAAAAGQGLCAGRVVDELQCRVMMNQWGIAIGTKSHEEFLAMMMKQGEAGEIIVCGEHVLKGYLDGLGNDETKILVDGNVWHRTGDAGYFDQQGRLWLLGRCSAVIEVRGKTIYPFAIECMLRSHFPTGRTAIMSSSSGLVLVIDAKITASDDDIKRILPNDSIDRMIRIEKIPLDRRHNAKVDYPALRKIVSLMIDM
jgi:acyl-CoA synthetase (AMP-forming)/AMP-acid ligase II